MYSARICCKRASPSHDDGMFVVELDADTNSSYKKQDESINGFQKLNSVFLMIFLLFALSLLSVLLLMVWMMLPGMQGAYAEVCKSDECRAASNLFRRTMDLNADPCDDFYKFACGNFNRSSSSYLDHTTLTRQRTLEELVAVTQQIGKDPDDPAAVIQMKIFYDSCLTHQVNSSTVTILREIIESFLPPNETLGTTLARIRRLTGQGYIVGSNIGPDYINTTENRIFFDQPQLVIPKGILLASNGDPFTGLLFSGMANIWKQVYKDFPVENVNDTIRQILELESDIARATTNDDERTKPGMFNLVSLDGINDLFIKRQSLEDPQPEIGVPKTRLKLNWIEYTSKLFENIAEINGNTLVDVKDVQYMLGLSGIIAKTSVKGLRNYLRWQLLYTFASDLLQTQSEMYDMLTKNKPKLSSQWGREIKCIQLMDTLLPFALSYKYIKKRSPGAIIKETQNILKDIVFSFQEMVAESSWMEPGTKLKAIKKAGNVRAFLGSPKWSRSGTLLDQYYEGLEFRDSDFIHNTLEALKWVSEKDLKLLNFPVDTEWSGTSDSPTEVDCFYDDELNSITVPLGFLQQPFVGLGLRSIDYGALGFFLGHELTHGFDTEGRYSDENGRLSSWWTPQTLENFNQKTHCIQQQYDQFFVPEVNATVNGKQTLKENIADNGGLELAFRAYHLHTAVNGEENLTLPGLGKYNSDQLFFLSFAQSWCSYVSPTTLLDMVRSNEHSPPKFRVWGSVSNFVDFSSVWQCKNNSRMNPTNKCHLW